MAARLLLPVALLAIAFGVFFTITNWGGAVVFWAFALGGIGLVARLPRQPIGWLVLGIGLTFVIVGSSPPGSASQVVDGQANLQVTLQAWGNGWGAGLFFMGLIALAAVFPSGRLSPRRMGVANRLAIAVPALFTVAQAFAPSFGISFADGTSARVTNPIGIGREWVGWPLFTEGIYVVFLVGLAVTLGTFPLRFRRAHDAERQQYKWLLFALAGVLGTFIFAFAMIAFVDPNGTWMWFPAVLTYPIVPVAVGIAVLRYRLYEIDRIINRTLAYADPHRHPGRGLRRSGARAAGACCARSPPSPRCRWPSRPCWWRPCSARSGAGCRRSSTGASTARATTRPGWPTASAPGFAPARAPRRVGRAGQQRPRRPAPALGLGLGARAGGARVSGGQAAAGADCGAAGLAWPPASQSWLAR